MKRTTPSNGLSLRANRCLAKAGIQADKEAIAHLLRNGTMYPCLWPPAYGPTTHAELCRWAGVDPEPLRPRLNDGPVTPFPDIGLSYRAWKCLQSAGIPATKEAAREAVLTGALSPGKRPGSYGRGTHAEICQWVGLNPTAITPPPNLPIPRPPPPTLQPSPSPAEIQPDQLPALLEKAIVIAVEAHRGHLDKYGAPYILHALRVMHRVHTDAARIVAILHDIVEDTPWTFTRLRTEGFPDDILAALDSVTKRESETYEDFVNRSAANPIARQVKLADLEDNMDLRRIPEITPRDLERLAKYRKAWSLLRDPNLH